MPARPCLLASPLLALVAVAVAGCSDSGKDATAATLSPSQRGALPALARRAPARGEIVVRGESSPASHGPFELDGRYLVRFEQYAPEDPRLDFSQQTPFTAALQRRAGDPRGAVELFGRARGRDRRELTIDGRYVLDVSFGDFPYVVRFTPRR